MTSEELLIFSSEEELAARILELGGIDVAEWPKKANGKTGLQVLFDEIRVKEESDLFVVDGRLLRRVQTTAAGVLYGDLRLTEKNPESIRIELLVSGIGVMGKVPKRMSAFDQLKTEVWEEMGLLERPLDHPDGPLVRSFVCLEDGQIEKEGEFPRSFISGTYPRLECQNLFHLYRISLTSEQYLADGYFHFTSKNDPRFLIWSPNELGSIGVDKDLLRKP